MASSPSKNAIQTAYLPGWAQSRRASSNIRAGEEPPSSAECGRAEAAALTSGGCVAVPLEPFPVALHPVKPVGTRHANTAGRKIILENEIIYRAPTAVANRRSRRRVTMAETAIPTK